jgi:hypothetical protein
VLLTLGYSQWDSLGSLFACVLMLPVGNLAGC